MSRDCLEHFDVMAAARTGYAGFQNPENQDSPENRAEYIEEHAGELIDWLRLGYPEILEEFIAFSGQACRTSYQQWLN